jgi:hypothetical protein
VVLDLVVVYLKLANLFLSENDVVELVLSESVVSFGKVENPSTTRKI